MHWDLSCLIRLAGLKARSSFDELENVEDVYEHATMGNFLNKMIDYPGGINQDMVLHLWLQNPLKWLDDFKWPDN